MNAIPCDLCSQKATVYFTQIVDGKMQKVNLCEKCAREKGVTDPTGFALADLLFGMGQQQSVAKTGTGQGHPSCPICGTTAEILKKTGRVGCANCYQVFGQTLGQILVNMHRGSQHTGKVPKRFLARRSMALKIEELRRDLDLAVSEERFEEAARLRDAILACEKGDKAVS